MWMPLLLTCLMTITQYNSNNSLTPKFKWAFSKSEKFLMNSLTYRPKLKKDIWSNFGLCLKIKHQDRHAQSGIRARICSWSTIHWVFSKFAKPLDLQQKSTIRMLFMAKPVYPKTYSPPLEIRLYIKKATGYEYSKSLKTWALYPTEHPTGST